MRNERNDLPAKRAKTLIAILCSENNVSEMKSFGYTGQMYLKHSKNAHVSYMISNNYI